MKSKDLQLQAANLNTEVTQNDITLQITQAYLNILLAKESIVYAKELAEGSRTQYEQGKSRYTAGSIAKKDLLQLEAQAAGDQYNLVNAQNQYRQNVLILKQTLQLPTTTDFKPVLPDTLIAEQAIPSLLEAPNILRPGCPSSLTIDDIKAIQSQAQYINAVSPAVQGRGQAINGALNWPTSMQSVSPDFLDIRNWPLKDGIAFDNADINGATKVCLIGQTVVENIFDPADDPLGKTIRFNKIPFKIIGVLAEKGENAFGQDQDDIILAPYTTVQKRILAIPYIQTIYASATSSETSEPATQELSQILRTSHKLTNAEQDDFTVPGRINKYIQFDE